ncbi:hypothetical protein BDP55DRAFT_614551 [Colletotrichum godetiae]|uniref:Uncharacterized protein n=1 Tax=Colletotrichum godetiae TaxID=1209918 RepID=A0AAJ0EVJ6_9PEZI|nr:uncharacterized protein BDP55DRAFT_614551 [Colletotrichum godetiae]KAK1673330.1 hypothetical protein BDP55DRAFT_614551 [Colletotrichum godetiae]
MHRLRVFITIWSLLLASVACQEAPIWVQGALEDATATDDAFNTGGTIVVNGFTVNVPKNLLVQFPAAWVPWKEFVANKADFTGYETLVIGNSINGEPRVAQIQMYEFFEGLSSGFIESLDFADGSLKIQNGPTSPSITSFSGFPMCIPRNESDPFCPLSNRPFVGPGTFTAPDPVVMAPFQAGDFITFSGFRRGAEVIAFSIVAQNVQINTLGDVVYVRMELGLLGIDNPNPNAEIAESRFIGFVSNNRATVSLYAMDVDPCTGATTNRIIASMGLRGGRNAQNKFEYRNNILFRYTREYRVTAEIDGVAKTRVTKNGITAGTYVQPVNVWVPGEQDVPGVPPVSYDFSQMEFLTKGVGADDDGNVWGPLEPFPQTGVLIEPPVCAAARGLELEKRGQISRWYGRARADAISQAENVDTTEAFVNIAPEEAAAIAKKKAEEEAINGSP